MTMRHHTLLLAAASSLLLPACKTRPKEAPAPTPASRAEAPTSHDARMAWWREARFGMFIHWGIYAVPAGEWKGHRTKSVAEWIMHTEKIPLSEYEPLAGRFNPTGFNAKEWVAIAKNAGMKYIVITSKHHDGFAMFDTATTTYDIVDGTPYGRDPMKDLAEECRRQGLRLCFYHSILDWRHPDYIAGRMEEAYIPYMKAQLGELLTNYGPIGVLWFDGEWDAEWTEERGADLASYVRGLQPDIIINNRVGKARAGMSGRSSYKGAGDYDTPEQEIPATGIPGMDWETCMTMNDTWGYSKLDHNWKSERTLIRMLCDTSSKGGNFLLNVGPTAEGLIPPESVERLAAVGRWMKTNSRAVYGTSAGPIGRVPWGRCTADGDTLYLMVFDWPSNGELLVPRLKNKPKRASLMAGGARLTARRTDGGMVISLPSAAPDADASVIVLELDGPPLAEPIFIGPGPDGVFTLDSTEADTTARLEEHAGLHNIGYWTSAEQRASWQVSFPAPGAFKVRCLIACQPGEEGDAFTVSCQGRSVTATVPATAGWRDYTWVECGTLSIPSAGVGVLTVAPAPGLKGALMNLREVQLVPAE